VISPYPNQEVGIVIEKGKPIFSLRYLDKLPGFLDMYQAANMENYTLEKAVEEIVRTTEKKASGGTSTSVESIGKKADAVLNQIATPKARPGNVMEILVPAAPEAYRRVLVRPERLRANIIPRSTTTDQWLNENRPRMFDWTDLEPTQHGLLFNSGGSPRYIEFSYSGEIFFGETFPKSDHIVVSVIAERLGQMLDYAIRAYNQFGYKGRIVVEFKLVLPDMKGWYLADMGIKPLFSKAYKPLQTETILERTISFGDLTKDPIGLVTGMLVELCRGFRFSYESDAARDYVAQILGQQQLFKPSTLSDSSG
jgi:hypothetical protein